jgi:hypothetical protein
MEDLMPEPAAVALHVESINHAPLGVIADRAPRGNYEY